MSPTCKHCKHPMVKLDTRHLEYEVPFLWVCDNDDCPVYARSAEHSLKTFGKALHYRYAKFDEGEDIYIPSFW